MERGMESEQRVSLICVAYNIYVSCRDSPPSIFCAQGAQPRLAAEWNLPEKATAGQVDETVRR